MARSTLWVVLKYLLALGLLGYVVYANWAPLDTRGLRDVWQAHVVDRQPIAGNALLASCVLIGACVLVTTYRWYLLMRAQDLPVTWPAALRIGLMGYFFNTFLPGSVGGDIVKAAAVAREQHRRAAAVATVIMDRVLGLWSLVSFVAVVGGIGALAGMLDDARASTSQVFVYVAIGIVGVSVVAWVLMGLVLRSGTERVADTLRRIPRIGALLAEFWQVVGMYRRRQGYVAIAIVLSWITDALHVTAIYWCGLTLWDGLASNPLPTFAQHFLIVPVGNMLAAIPLFPGGAGINEAGFGGLYALFGSAASNGVLAALVSRFVTWIVGVVGFLVYQCMRSDVKQLHMAPEPAVAATTPDQIGPATVDGLV